MKMSNVLIEYHKKYNVDWVVGQLNSIGFVHDKNYNPIQLGLDTFIICGELEKEKWSQVPELVEGACAYENGEMEICNVGC